MPDGRLILAVLHPSGGGSDLLMLPADGGKADELIKTEFSEDSARVSPDGRWLAYRSNRSGRSEIWVRATAGSAPVRVSQDGGREPTWSRDGRELFYLQGLDDLGTYDVAADGRFLMIPESGDPN